MAVRLVVRHPKSAAGEAGEARFEFEQARVVIGRGAGADVRLPGLSVSSVHATIEQQGSHYTLRDEGSTNGTLVNDALLVPSRPRVLLDGDCITIAEFSLWFSSGALRIAHTSPERTSSLARRMLRELVGSQSDAGKPPFLHVIEGPQRGLRRPLDEPPSRLVIGRGADSDLLLSEADVSSAHVEVVRDHDGTVVRDLDQRGGIEINGKRVRERRLRHGDTLRLGATSMRFEDPAEQALRELEQQPDRTYTRTAPAAPASPDSGHGRAASEPRASSSAAVHAAEPPLEAAPVEGAPEIDSAPPATPVDLLVYALATLVLLLSLAGLLWLFGKTG